MKKLAFFTGFAGLACFANAAIAAAYPVYAAGNQLPAGYVQPMVQPVVQQQVGYVQPVMQQGVQYVPVNTGTTAAASPTRVTGALPRVGSNTTIAGRQYYQPQDYDRLSDSGLYVGLSVGYSTSINGGMKADYASEANSWYVPGSFKQESFKTDTVLPLQISVGAAINSDFRVDFSYTRYSQISYADIAHTSDGMGGTIDARATGGSISSNTTMLNLYYNIDSYTGNLAGGMLRPYVGVGLGISMNTISDYLIYDGSFYPEVADGTPSPLGELTAISDIYAYHSGGTTEQLAYMFEGGVSTELDGGIKLDFFVRYSGLGKVQSSGSIVVSQTEWIGTGVGVIGEAGAEEPAPYDSVFHYTNWREKGNLTSLDVGIRLRLQF